MAARNRYDAGLRDKKTPKIQGIQGIQGGFV